VAWTLLPQFGNEVLAAYWSEFSPYGRGSEFPLINEAAKQLIRHGRVAIAVDALSIYSGRWEDGVEADVVVEALSAFGNAGDPDVSRVSDYDVTRLLEFLKSRQIDETTIARFEWKFLPLLHDESRAPELQRLLAREPEVFVQLIELVFKPANAAADAEREPANQALVSNAYRLLRSWKVVPGVTEDGSVDGSALERWLAETRDRLAASDRLEVGEVHIGEVLAHAPEDADGTFPTVAVRDVLESAPNDHLERGFRIGASNKRGVTSRSITEGGQQEYDLSAQYEAWAEAVQATHPRTAATLRDIADSYREEGRRNDEEVRRFLEGLDE
jgi:hypothetical protein